MAFTEHKASFTIFYVQDYQFPIKCNLSNSFDGESCEVSLALHFDMYQRLEMI